MSYSVSRLSTGTRAQNKNKNKKNEDEPVEQGGNATAAQQSRQPIGTGTHTNPSPLRLQNRSNRPYHLLEPWSTRSQTETSQKDTSLPSAIKKKNRQESPRRLRPAGPSQRKYGKHRRPLTSNNERVFLSTVSPLSDRGTKAKAATKVYPNVPGTVSGTPWRQRETGKGKEGEVMRQRGYMWRTETGPLENGYRHTASVTDWHVT